MLIIVAVDGNDVVPFKTDIFVIKPGESVDYIIFTDRPHDNYRINYITTATSDVTGVSSVFNKFIMPFYQNKLSTNLMIILRLGNITLSMI